MTERQQFEKWVKTEMCMDELDRYPTTGDYEDNHIRDMWDAWNAASDFHKKKPIPKSLAASTLGSIKSPKRSAASRANGKLGGRPITKKPVTPHCSRADRD